MARTDVSTGGGGSGVTIGDPVTGGTAGSVLFVGATGLLAQDNANFSYSAGAQALTLTNALNVHFIQTTGGVVLWNVNTRTGLDSSGVTSVDVQNRYLKGTTGAVRVDYQNGFLQLTAGTVRYDWTNGLEYDNGHVIEHDIANRTFYDTAAFAIISYQTTNVGIGLTSPLTRLHVQQDQSAIANPRVLLTLEDTDLTGSGQTSCGLNFLNSTANWIVGVSNNSPTLRFLQSGIVLFSLGNGGFTIGQFSGSGGSQTNFLISGTTANTGAISYALRAVMTNGNSGTGGFGGITIDANGTYSGSGEQNLFVGNLGGVKQFGVSTTGIVTIAGSFIVPKTITPTLTTGAQTINKMSGSVNFAALATSLVVTNSLVSTSSVILATVATNDLTMTSVQAVAGIGSFTLFANVAPGATTRVNFRVTN